MRSRAAIVALALSCAAAPATADPLPPALRVTAELHAGLLSVAAGAGVGLLLADTQADCSSSCRGGWGMVGAVVGLIAVPFATYAVGALGSGGQSELPYTLLGFGLGMQLDAFVTVLVHKLVGDRPGEVPTIAWVLAGTIAVAAPLVGSALGAEW